MVIHEQHAISPAVAQAIRDTSIAVAAATVGSSLPVHILTSIQAEDRWQRMEARLSNFRTNFTKFTGIDARHHIPDLAQVDWGQYFLSLRCWLEATVRGIPWTAASKAQSAAPRLSCLVIEQGRTNWTEALEVSPGLDIEALQTFHLAPSPLCANTTSAHYACTISHLFMLLEAYHSGEVSSCLSVVAVHICL